jgi:hypothetical protein
MKYPLRVAYTPALADRYAIADARGKIVCRVVDEDWDREFAEFIVRSANRWRWRRWFRYRTREDWLWERHNA